MARWRRRAVVISSPPNPGGPEANPNSKSIRASKLIVTLSPILKSLALEIAQPGDDGTVLDGGCDTDGP